MAGTMGKEPEIGGKPLAGTPGNPAHEPKKLAKEGKGSIGDKAFMDAVCIVVAAWLILLLFAYTLRHHNV